MSKLVNLNQFRKAKARADKRRQSDENAFKFGRSKAQRSLDQARTDKARRELDGHETE